MKKYIITIILTVLGVCSCKDTETIEPIDTTPRLISIVPGRGETGSAAIVSGCNFSETISDNEVTIGGRKAEIVTASHNRLLVTVPENEPGEYAVSVTVKGVEVDGVSYVYVDAPAEMKLISAVPSAGFPGDTVAIYGQGFGDDMAALKVMFDEAEGKVVFSTRNIIHVVAPQHDEGDCFFTVSDGSSTVDGVKFVYRHQPVFSMTSVSPAQGYAGSTAVIYGELFSTIPSENILTINGQQAEIVAATSEKLTFTLPANEEGTYSFSLKVGDKEISGLEFTYLAKPYILNYWVGSGATGQTDGIGTAAVIACAQDLHFMEDGRIWAVMRNKHSIRVIDPKTAEVKTLVEDATNLNNVWQGSFDSKGVFQAAVKAKGWLASINSTGVVSTFKLTNEDGSAYALSSPMDVACGPDDVLYVAVRDNVPPGSTTKGCIVKAVNHVVKEIWPAQSISTIEIGPDGKLYWGSENYNRLCVTDPETSKTTVIAGNGTAPNASTFTNGDAGNPSKALIAVIRDIKFGSDGSLLFTEQNASVLRRLKPSADGDYTKGTISVLAGQPCVYKGGNANDGLPALAAVFSQYLYAVLPEPGMKTIYLADGFNYRINKLVLED